MKKLFIVLVLGAFVACNESGSADAAVDSTANVIDSTADAATDSVGVMKDSVISNIDSIADAKKDSLPK